MTPRKNRRSISPQATLVLALAAALVVLAGGSFLAWRVEHVHVVGDRQPVQRAGDEMAKEFGQLEQLYEKHLRQLATVTASLDGTAQVSDFCGSIVGVGQWSLIHYYDNGVGDVHVAVTPSPSGPWPQPTLQVKGPLPGPNDWLLSRDDLLQAFGSTWGWIADPGRPLLFWQRTDARDGGVVVMLVNQQAVHDALDGWLAPWVKKAFMPLQIRNGPLCAFESSNHVLVATGVAPNTPPDFILPIRSLFGTWQIAAWDRVVTRNTYDVRILLIAVFIAALIVFLGVITFLQQRRLLAQTAQRVTFVNRVSHELRSPLTNILLNLDLSLQMLADRAERPAHRLALVQEEAHRLRRLVDNVLTFSAIEQRKQRPTLRAGVPGEIVASVVSQFATSFARRGVTAEITGEADDPRLLDADAITQILANLFSNIEKYVPGGLVRIHVALEDEVLAITVSDEGPGIPPAEAERIFQPFERIDDGINEGASGTGLGLSIARDLAVGLGGSLQLLPSRRGAKFELRVPAFPLVSFAESSK